jgi:aryl-phospho-beta-D-glucosidase BglC (GH1 family)
MKRWIALAAAVVLCVGSGRLRADGPSPERVARLARGVNLSHWLWLPQGKTAAERDAWFTAADARTLREAGLTHVRLPFDADQVWDRGAGALREDGCAELERAVARCVGAGLAVVVDAHPRAAEWLRPDPEGRLKDLEAMWAVLARRLAGSDPEWVLFEVLNEPHDLKDPAIWPAEQERLVAIIRAAAPRHTIIATGDDYGNIDGLLRLKPLADSNVVYSFHFYEPHDFTHQGATWGAPHWKYLKGLPYPSSPENVDGAVRETADEHAASVVRRYGRERWGAERVSAEIRRAAAWGARHHVAVYCGEFGVYREFSPRESRLAWLRDVGAALKEQKIGWAMWDYAGGFAMMEASRESGGGMPG